MAKAKKTNITINLSDRQIDNRAKKAIELQAKIAELKAELDAVQEELKNFMSDAQEEHHDTGNYVINYTSYVKSSVDSSALKRDGLYEQYIKTQLSSRFQITDSKQKK